MSFWIYPPDPGGVLEMPPVTPPMTGRTLGATTSSSVSPLSSGQTKTFLPGRTRLRTESNRKKEKHHAPPGRGKINGYNNGNPVVQRADFRSEEMERKALHVMENAWLRSLRSMFRSKQAPTPASEQPTQRMPATRAPAAPGVIKGATATSKTPSWKTDTAPAMPTLGAEEPEKMTADPATPPEPKKPGKFAFKESDEAVEKLTRSVLKTGPQPLKRGEVRTKRPTQAPPLGLDPEQERRKGGEDDAAENVIRDWHRKHNLPWAGVKPKLQRRRIYNSPNGGKTVFGGPTITLPKSLAKKQS